MEQFSYETNGYNRSEVNQFIDDVITQTEDIVSRCQKQRDEIAKLKQELEHYKNMEDISNDMRRVARDESLEIIRTAKENANRIVNEALMRANKVEDSSVLLEKNMEIFKKKLKLIVEQQLKIVDEIEVLELEP